MLQRHATVIGWAGVAACVLVWAWHALTQQAVPSHDELGHLLVARDAWTRPRLFFNEWGRTVNTAVFMPVALLPLAVARLWAVLLCAGGTLFLWLAAREKNLPFHFLIPWLMLLQRQSLEQAWQALTLPPLIFFGMLVLWLAGRERWLLVGLVMGLLPLIRHETLALAGIVGLLLFFRRRWLAGLLTGLPIVVNYLLAFVLFRDPPFRIFLNPRPTDHYGQGEFWHFIQTIVFQAGMPVLVLALFGLVPCLRHRHFAIGTMLGGVYFLIHAVLFRFALYGTGGYAAFLFPMAPILAMLAALGLHGLLQEIPPKAREGFPFLLGRERFVRIGVVIFFAVWIASSALRMQEYERQPHEKAIDEAIAVIEREGLSGRPVVTSHVWYYYFRPAPIPRDDIVLWINDKNMAELEPGTLVLWEPNYSEKWNVNRTTLEGPGFRVVWKDPESWVTLFERVP